MGAHFSFLSFESPIPLSSSSSDSSNFLSITDRLTGNRVSLALVADGKLQSPAQLRAQIMRPLELIKTDAWLLAQRSPRCKHRRHAALPPIASIFGAHRACQCGRVRLMFPYAAFVCQRLATAPASVHTAFSLRMWSWAAWIMERVTRGRVRRLRLQVLLQRRACCAVLCACRASACVRCVFDACCRKRWLILRWVTAHRSGGIKRAAAFILVRRLLLAPALQADLGSGIRHKKVTDLRCFAT